LLRYRTIGPNNGSETPADCPVATLDGLLAGQRARIVEVAGDDAIAVRLLEMGLTEGEEIALLGFAPLGDPIEFEVRGYRISLRSSEARRVRVDCLTP
jgi:ferrous iron transport protein A